MTRYLVTDDNIRCAIHEAIECQDKDPQGDNYVIASSADVVNHVLRIFDKVRVAKSEQTENCKQDAGREIDTSEYPIIRLEAIKAADLVDLICNAYQKGKDYQRINGEDSNERRN